MKWVPDGMEHLSIIGIVLLLNLAIFIQVLFKGIIEMLFEKDERNKQSLLEMLVGRQALGLPEKDDDLRETVRPPENGDELHARPAGEELPLRGDGTHQ